MVKFIEIPFHLLNPNKQPLPNNQKVDLISKTRRWNRFPDKVWIGGLELKFGKNWWAPL